MSHSSFPLVSALCLGFSILGRMNCVSLTSHLPNQCTEYMVLDEADRSVSAGGCGYNGADQCCCDGEEEGGTPSTGWQGPGYYRMLSPAGTMLPESSPGSGRCGTGGSGWLQEEHPREVGVEETMTVCFAVGDDYGSCWEEVEITVTNCDGFFVYMLPDTVYCDMRYCASN